NERRGPRMTIEQDIFPRYKHVVEYHQAIDLIETIGKRVVLDRTTASEAVAAYELQIGRAELADEADRVVRQFRVAPIGDRGLSECLIGVGRRSLVFRTAHDDSGVGLLDNMEQHVGILLLRSLRAVAFWIGVSRNVESVALDHSGHVSTDVLCKLRI